MALIPRPPMEHLPRSHAVPGDHVRLLEMKIEDASDGPRLFYHYAQTTEDGHEHELYKYVRLIRVLRVPYRERELETFIDIHKDLLAGVWQANTHFLTLIENTVRPSQIGLVYYYGVQGTSDNPREALDTAQHAYYTLRALLQGNYAQLMYRPADSEELFRVLEKTQKLPRFVLFRGIPQARKTAGDVPKTGIAGPVSKVVEQQVEEFVRAMINRNFLYFLQAQPVAYGEIARGLDFVSRDYSRWASQTQGTKTVSAGLTMPFVMMGSTGTATSEGQTATHGDTDTQSISRTDTVSTSETVGITHGVGQNQSVSYGESVGTSQTAGISQGLSSSTTIGHSEGTTVGVTDTTSISHSQGQSITQTHGTSQSYGTSESETYTTTRGTSETTGVSHSWDQSFSEGVSVSHTEGASQSQGATAGISETTGGSESRSAGESRTSSTGTSTTMGLSGGGGLTTRPGAQGANLSADYSTGIQDQRGASVDHSISQTTNRSVASNISQNTSRSVNISDGWSASQSRSYGESVSQNYSVSSSFSESVAKGRSISYGQSVSDSIAYGTSEQVTEGFSKSISHSTSYTDSLSQTQGKSVGTSYTHSVSQGQNTGLSYGQSVSKSVSHSLTSGKSVADTTGRSFGTTDSLALSRGRSENLGMSTGLTMGPSLSAAKSYQWVDARADNVRKILEAQRTRLLEALQGQGAFHVDVGVFVEDDASVLAASAAAKSAWYGDVLPTPFESLPLTPEEEAHLRAHFQLFTPCLGEEPVPGLIDGYKYSTVLLAGELAALTHPLRAELGGSPTAVEDVPTFRVPAVMNGDIYMGTILASSKWTPEDEFRTPYEYRLSRHHLGHTLFVGASRSGKTVGALRFVAEIAKLKNPTPTIVALDWKSDWRALARVVEPSRFRFYSMAQPDLGVRMNVIRVPEGVDPHLWLDVVAETFALAYGLGQRGYSIIWDHLQRLYDEHGVFDDPTQSRKVTLHSLYRAVSFTLAAMDAPSNQGQGKPRLGFDTKERLQAVLDRLVYYQKGKWVEMFCYDGDDALTIEDLCAEDGRVTVLEAQGMASLQKVFLIGILTSGIWSYIQAKRGHRNGLFLILEEAHEVVRGADVTNKQNLININETVFETMYAEGMGLGLNLVTITQTPTKLPPTCLANSPLLFAYRMLIEEDISTIVRMISRDPRYDHRDIARWFTRQPTGWCVARTSRVTNFLDADPVLLETAMIKVTSPSDDELAIWSDLSGLKKD
ncbi:MAG: serine-rich protein [Clostridiales bacterium]|nr:serine-rich protein [Clostridiales bacterium]